MLFLGVFPRTTWQKAVDQVGVGVPKLPYLKIK